MKDYEDFDGLGLADLVKRGETSAEALLDAALTRFEARDDALGAVVFRMEDEARKSIAACTETGLAL